jgi:hypothetical protein
MTICPICATETGRAVRESLADESLAVGLAAIVGPFIVLGLLVWALRHLVAVRSAWPANEP